MAIIPGCDIDPLSDLALVFDSLAPHCYDFESLVPLLPGCNHLAFLVTGQFNFFVDIYGIRQDGKSVVTYSGFDERGDL